MKVKSGIIGFGLLLSLIATYVFSLKTMSYQYGAKAYDKKFLQAIEVIFAHEGGYVDDPHDRGGESKYGITQHN